MRELMTSMKLWFPLLLAVVISLVYIEVDTSFRFYQTFSDPARYSVLAFAFAVGLLGGYKAFKKCDYLSRSDAGSFGLKLLPIGVLVTSLLGLFFGYYLLMFGAGVFTPDLFRKSFAAETLGVFFIALSFALIILGAYLLFKFQIWF